MHSRQFITDNFKFDKNDRDKLARVTRKVERTTDLLPTAVYSSLS